MGPRVIRSSDAKVIWTLVAILAAFIFCLLPGDPGHSRLGAEIGILLCPAAAVLVFLMLLFPPTLVLTAEGFEIRALRRHQVVAWRDVAVIAIRTSWRRGLVRHDEATWTSTPEAGGRTHSLEGLWREKPAEIVEAMQAYHRAATSTI